MILDWQFTDAVASLSAQIADGSVPVPALGDEPAVALSSIGEEWNTSYTDYWDWYFDYPDNYFDYSDYYNDYTDYYTDNIFWDYMDNLPDPSFVDSYYTDYYDAPG